MTVTPRLRPSYFVRQAIVGGLSGGIGLMLVYMGVRRGFLPLVGFGCVTALAWLVVAVHAYRQGAREIDGTRVVRRDGKVFLWTDWQETREGRVRLPSGQLGPLNHVDLIFTAGKVRIFPFTLENAGEVLAMTKHCRTCGEWKDYEFGSQKGGREEEDVFLPNAATRLEKVKETEPGRNRSPVLKRCPECGTYYLYEVEYEYLVSGSEDNQTLTRLSPEEAAKYLGS